MKDLVNTNKCVMAVDLTSGRTCALVPPPEAAHGTQWLRLVGVSAWLCGVVLRQGFRLEKWLSG